MKRRFGEAARVMRNSYEQNRRVDDKSSGPAQVLSALTEMIGHDGSRAEQWFEINVEVTPFAGGGHRGERVAKFFDDLLDRARAPMLSSIKNLGRGSKGRLEAVSRFARDNPEPVEQTQTLGDDDHYCLRGVQLALDRYSKGHDLEQIFGAMETGLFHVYDTAIRHLDRSMENGFEDLMSLDYDAYSKVVTEQQERYHPGAQEQLRAYLGRERERVTTLMSVTTLFDVEQEAARLYQFLTAYHYRMSVTRPRDFLKTFAQRILERDLPRLGAVDQKAVRKLARQIGELYRETKHVFEEPSPHRHKGQAS